MNLIFHLFYCPWQIVIDLKAIVWKSFLKLLFVAKSFSNDFVKA